MPFAFIILTGQNSEMYKRTSCIEMDIGQNHKLTTKTKGTVPRQSAQKVCPYFNSLKITRVEQGTGVIGEDK